MRAALAVALALIAGDVCAQTAAPEIVRLAPARRLVGETYALPQIATPANPATAKINSELKRQDRVWQRGRAECVRRGKESYVDRGARATMLGPEFFAVEARHDAYCDGAAHPNQFPDFLTYDLRTGAAVDWSKLIPGITQHDPELGAGWGDVSPTVTWPAGHRLYAAKIRAGATAKDSGWWAECREEVERGEGDFLIHADPQAGGVAIEPNWLSHVAQNCAEPAILTAADLRRLNADPRLIAALEAARRAHAWQREMR